MENGRVLVPMRAIAEAMGATVNWNSDTQTADILKGIQDIKMQIGNNTMLLNGVSVQLDVPPEIIGGRTLVPARAIAEAFGADVTWDADEYAVYITSNAGGDGWRPAYEEVLDILRSGDIESEYFPVEAHSLVGKSGSLFDYAYVDLNDDGTPELLIKGYAIYGFDGNKAVVILNNWGYRVNGGILPDKTIYEWSSARYGTYWRFYKVDADGRGLVTLDRLSYDTATGLSDPAYGKVMTEDEINEIGGRYISGFRINIVEETADPEIPEYPIDWLPLN